MAVRVGGFRVGRSGGQGEGVLEFPAVVVVEDECLVVAHGDDALSVGGDGASELVAGDEAGGGGELGCGSGERLGGDGESSGVAEAGGFPVGDDAEESEVCAVCDVEACGVAFEGEFGFDFAFFACAVFASADDVVGVFFEAQGEGEVGGGSRGLGGGTAEAEGEGKQQQGGGCAGQGFDVRHAVVQSGCGWWCEVTTRGGYGV